jgi:N-acetyltransferase
MNDWVRPVTLQGRRVRLEPLTLEHVPDLAAAGADEDIWRFMLYGTPTGEAQMRRWVEDMLARRAAGGDLPFAAVHLQSGRAVGATRYMEVRPEHRAVEIGGTWYARAHQRTALNTECKYLLLTHAFERLGCIRVQFKTDARNERSQRALERIGAVREGVLRQHMLLADGYRRDSVYYSIIDGEWPGVKAHLETLLER